MIKAPFAGMRLPVLAAPMFLNSSVELVVACARAGIAAAFPSLNPREAPVLADWLDEIAERCAQTPGAARRYGVNLVVNRTNTRLDSHLKVVCDKKVPFVVTSLGANTEVVAAIHAAGGLVLHDVISRRHAEKAIEAGVDGLILVSAGAGGHGGTLNPLAFIAEIREMFDGMIALAGGISTGRGVAAARAAGADFAYMGTRFVATREANAEQGYREMIEQARAGDIVYTNRVSGVHGNFLRASIEASGLDLAAAAPEYAPGALREAEKRVGAWSRIWSAGHGVGTIHGQSSVAELVAGLEAEYRGAIAELAA